MIELFGLRLAVVPIAAAAFAVGVRRTTGLAWTAAFLATMILVLALVSLEDAPADLALAYALVNASETYLIAFAILLALTLAWRALRRQVRRMRAATPRR